MLLHVWLDRGSKRRWHLLSRSNSVITRPQWLDTPI